MCPPRASRVCLFPLDCPLLQAYSRVSFGPHYLPGSCGSLKQVAWPGCFYETADKYRLLIQVTRQCRPSREVFRQPHSALWSPRPSVGRGWGRRDPQCSALQMRKREKGFSPAPLQGLFQKFPADKSSEAPAHDHSESP